MLPFIDALSVVAIVVFASAVLGGPVEIQLLHQWRITWVGSGVVTIALLVIRHLLRPAPHIGQDLISRAQAFWSLTATREALRATLITRAGVFLAGWLAVVTIGHAPSPDPPRGNPLAQLPGVWDATWYLGIASNGYRWAPDQPNVRVAFFPGFPVALRVVARLLHLPDDEPAWLWTGVVVSVLCFWLALLVLHRFAEILVDADAATRAIWLTACYPFSLFYGQLYTESLFLLAAVAACYFLKRGRPLTAAIFGATVGLVRPTGVLVALPMAWDALVAMRSPDQRAPGRLARTLVAVASPAVGLAAYAAYMKHVSGQWLAWMSAQVAWGRQPRSPWMLLVEIADYVRAHGLTSYLHDRPYDVANIAAVVFALGTVVPVARRFGPGLAAFVLLSVVIPLTAGGWLSIGRFTSVLFPMFIWLGAAATRPRVLLGVFAALEAVLATLFFTDRPIY
ncbi:MAG TPA: mannosyltransferase family protein [Vicinamibacterales bacterium]|nr:mannosyltransferase family protein [Vicinamibacterales bacterium]